MNAQTFRHGVPAQMFSTSPSRQADSSVKDAELGPQDEDAKVPGASVTFGVRPYTKPACNPLDTAAGDLSLQLDLAVQCCRQSCRYIHASESVPDLMLHCVMVAGSRLYQCTRPSRQRPGNAREWRGDGTA